MKPQRPTRIPPSLRYLKPTDRPWHLIADQTRPHEHDDKYFKSVLWPTCVVQAVFGTGDEDEE